MSGYFKRERLDWIDEALRIYGFINREHIVRKFGVSVPQASADLRDASQRNPAVHYDQSRKRYELRQA